MKYCIHNGIILNGISFSEGLSAILVENKKIVDVFTEERFAKKKFSPEVSIIDAKGHYIIPGLIDTHIHGFKGNGTDNCSTKAILQMSKDLAQYGVTAFNPTMYPSSIDSMIHNIRQIVSAMGKEEGAKIMNIHLEGPFISPEKLGVQKRDTIHTPDIKIFEQLFKASEGHIINMTVAPELTGMRELALYCINKGVVLQAGHTKAKYKNMIEGLQVGILHATHFFNAISQLHHRDPGAVGAVLTHPEISCEIIADGVHVHKDLFKLLNRNKNSDKIILVTDALTPTEQKEGPLFANNEEVILKDGCFHRKSDDVIAGSCLTLKKAVQNMQEFGYPLWEAVKFATSNPARTMNFKGKGIISPGYDGDIVVLDKDFKTKFVMIEGKIIKDRLKKTED